MSALGPEEVKQCAEQAEAGEVLEQEVNK